MGQFLALLRPNSEPSLPPLAAVDINRELTANPSEQQHISRVNSLLARAPGVLDSLRQYHGCDELIRKAISQPSPQNDLNAWDAVTPCVVKLRECYEFALQIDHLLPTMFATFCTPTPSGVDVQANLEANQATAKAFADVLSLAWEFDELKVSRPAIQNDFSYYRRIVSRTKFGPSHASAPPPVTEEMSGRMSLFYAYPGPLLKMITDTLTGYVAQNPHVADPVAKALLQIAMVCQNAIKVDANAALMPTLRTMTSCLILYDHIHPIGLFPKASEAIVRIFIRTIQACAGDSGKSLLNGLKYSSKTFNSPDVPKNIKAMFEPNSS